MAVVATPAPQRAAGRRKLAKAKKALPDGSFPIPNVDYLGRAIRAVGRAAPGKRPALARLIRKRARELGSAGMAKLKGSWVDNTQSAKAMSNALYGTLREGGYSHSDATLELSRTMPLLVLELARYDPDHDGDNDASKSGDTDKDYAGKSKSKKDMLSPKGRAVMKRLIARGMDAKKAYNIACYHTPGGMAKAA